MRTVRLISASVASPLLMIGLLLAAGQARAQLHDGEWASYRDAYRAMVVFEKYGGPKNFLQSQLQVLPRDPGVLGEGLQLTLAGKTTQLHLPLDPLGRTALPLQKAAYDENATLALSRKGISFALRPQVSIAARTDGVYDSADLRSACGQALGFARYADASQRNRQCVGARFVFSKKGEGSAHWRREGGAEEVLPVAPGAAEQGLPVVTYRFGSERGQVLTDSVPLAILPLFE